MEQYHQQYYVNEVIGQQQDEFTISDIGKTACVPYNSALAIINGMQCVVPQEDPNDGRVNIYHRIETPKCGGCRFDKFCPTRGDKLITEL